MLRAIYKGNFFFSLFFNDVIDYLTATSLEQDYVRIGFKFLKTDAQQTKYNFEIIIFKEMNKILMTYCIELSLEGR